MTSPSEFGKGFAYCLGLFLSHAHNIEFLKKIDPKDACHWFYGATDHLIELSIPDKIDDAKKLEIENFLQRVFEYRLYPGSTWADVETALAFAKNLLMHWDIVCGIDAAKSTYD